MRLLTLLCELNALIKAGAQFFLATHSPILMALPGAQLLELTESGIREAAYETIEHVQITKRFLNDPQGMLRRLFGTDPHTKAQGRLALGFVAKKQRLFRTRSLSCAAPKAALPCGRFCWDPPPGRCEGRRTG